MHFFSDLRNIITQFTVSDGVEDTNVKTKAKASSHGVRAKDI